MTPMVMFAASNPHEEGVSPAEDDIHAARMGLMGAFVCGDGSLGATIIDLPRMMIGNPGENYRRVLDAALVNCSAVFAVVDDRSMRVASVVATAQTLGIPVVIWRDSDHPSLLGPNTHQFPVLQHALSFIRELDLHRRPQMAAKAVLDAGATLPVRAHGSDAGFDLVYNGTADAWIELGDVADIPCGVSIEWPPNMWGLLIGRSSSFRNRGLLVNPAVIDPGFRGELFAIVRNIGLDRVCIQPGERVAQIVPLPALAPAINMTEAQSLSPSDRGRNGFGSSGR